MRSDKDNVHKKVCAACNEAFTCDAENDCWCEEKQIHRKEMMILIQEYKDCLCPSCLSVYSEN